MSDKLHVQCILIQKANGLLWVSGYQPPEIFFPMPRRGQGIALSSARRKSAKKRQRDRLGPFSNPHEVPMQEAAQNHRACKSPCGNLCAVVHSARNRRAQNNLLRGHQFAWRRLRPPLSYAHSGVSRCKPRGSRGVVCQWQTLNTDRAGRRDWCNPLPVFAYFLLGRKYEPVAA